MGLETGTYISDLVATNPVSSDPKSQGDDHLRLIKSTVKTTFPNVSGEVTPTHTELNYVDGVTSAIQTQIDLKAPLDSPILTGAPEAPTAAPGSNNNLIANTAFVAAAALSSSLPGQVGNAGKLITTDGTTASWSEILDMSVIVPSAGTALATTTGTQTLTNKTVTDLIIANAADPTKKANFVTSEITAGQNRTITVANRNIILDTPGWVYLSTVTANISATADIETTFSSTYDRYVVVLTGVQPSAALGVQFYARTKVGGVYTSGANDYIWSRADTSTSVTVEANHTGLAQIEIAQGVGDDGDRRLGGFFYIDNPSSTSFAKQCSWDLTYYDDGNSLISTYGTGINTVSSAAVTGVRFLFSSNNIEAGTFTLFGIRKA